jgi:sulfur carrier protein
MHVTVDVVNGPTETVAVADDATYADLLGAVGFGLHEATVLVDGAPVPEDAAVAAGEVRVLRLVSGG